MEIHGCRVPPPWGTDQKKCLIGRPKRIICIFTLINRAYLYIQCQLPVFSGGHPFNYEYRWINCTYDNCYYVKLYDFTQALVFEFLASRMLFVFVPLPSAYRRRFFYNNINSSVFVNIAFFNNAYWRPMIV